MMETVIPVVIGKLEKWARRIGNWRTNQDHSRYSIIENG